MDAATMEGLALLETFVLGADPDEFEGQDPFSAVEGGGKGLLLRLLVKPTPVGAMPVGKKGLALARFGHMVARAGLSTEDLCALEAFVDLGFPDAAAKYANAVDGTKKLLHSPSGQSGTVASKEKTNVPTLAEQELILKTHGARYIELVATGCAVALGLVPSETALEVMGYRSDPFESDTCTKMRKQGRSTALVYIRANDAVGLYDMHVNAAETLSARCYGVFAARFMSLVAKLHRMTIAVGFDEGYLNYWKMWLERKVCEPIEPQLCQEILTLTVLSRIGLTGGSGEATVKRLQEMEKLYDEERTMRMAQHDAINSLKSRVQQLSVGGGTPVGGGGDGDGGRSGGRKETSCWRCGSTEHMSWSPQCPKYDKEDADRRKAKRDAEREAEKKKDE